MLLEKTNDVLNDLDIYEKSKELSSKTQDLTKRLSTAKEIHNMLVRVDLSRIFLNENSIPTDLKETFIGLSGALNGLNSSISEDQANILKPNNFWRTNADKLEHKANDIFLFNWKKYISEHLLIKDEKELKIWAQIPELSGSAKKLQAFVSEVEKLKEQLPTMKEIRLIKIISEEMQKFMADLDKVGIPDNVSDFLSKASTVGVALSEINDELFDWLDKHGMKQYCQVKLAYNE